MASSSGWHGDGQINRETSHENLLRTIGEHEGEEEEEEEEGGQEDINNVVPSSSTVRRQKRLLKKAPDAPKRFKSAYICFVMERMDGVKEELEKDVKVTDLMRALATRWRELPVEERQKFEAMAETDKTRYFEEMSAYKGPMHVPNKRIKKNADAPKRAMSAFLSFSQAMRPGIRAEYPHMKNTDISGILAEKWREAPEEVKRPHIERELREREKYHEDMAKWKEEEAARIATLEAAKQRDADDNNEQQQTMAMMNNRMWSTTQFQFGSMLDRDVRQPWLSGSHGPSEMAVLISDDRGQGIKVPRRSHSSSSSGGSSSGGIPRDAFSTTAHGFNYCPGGSFADALDGLWGMEDTSMMAGMGLLDGSERRAEGSASPTSSNNNSDELAAAAVGDDQAPLSNMATLSGRINNRQPSMSSANSSSSSSKHKKMITGQRRSTGSGSSGSGNAKDEIAMKLLQATMVEGAIPAAATVSFLGPPSESSAWRLARDLRQTPLTSTKKAKSRSSRSSRHTAVQPEDATESYQRHDEAVGTNDIVTSTASQSAMSIDKQEDPNVTMSSNHAQMNQPGNREKRQRRHQQLYQHSLFQEQLHHQDGQQSVSSSSSMHFHSKNSLDGSVLDGIDRQQSLDAANAASVAGKSVHTEQRRGVRFPSGAQSTSSGGSSSGDRPRDAFSVSAHNISKCPVGSFGDNLDGLWGMEDTSMVLDGSEGRAKFSGSPTSSTNNGDELAAAAVGDDKAPLSNMATLSGRINNRQPSMSSANSSSSSSKHKKMITGQRRSTGSGSSGSGNAKDEIAMKLLQATMVEGAIPAAATVSFLGPPSESSAWRLARDLRQTPLTSTKKAKSRSSRSSRHTAVQPGAQTYPQDDVAESYQQHEPHNIPNPSSHEVVGSKTVVTATASLTTSFVAKPEAPKVSMTSNHEQSNRPLSREQRQRQERQQQQLYQHSLFQQYLQKQERQKSAVASSTEGGAMSSGASLPTFASSSATTTPMSSIPLAQSAAAAAAAAASMSMPPPTVTMPSTKRGKRAPKRTRAVIEAEQQQQQQQQQQMAYYQQPSYLQQQQQSSDHHPVGHVPWGMPLSVQVYHEYLQAMQQPLPSTFSGASSATTSSPHPMHSIHPMHMHQMQQYQMQQMQMQQQQTGPSGSSFTHPTWLQGYGYVDSIESYFVRPTNTSSSSSSSSSTTDYNLDLNTPSINHLNSNTTSHNNNAVASSIPVMDQADTPAASIGAPAGGSGEATAGFSEQDHYSVTQTLMAVHQATVSQSTHSNTT